MVCQGLVTDRQPLFLFLLSFLQVAELGGDLMVERRVGKRFGSVGIESGKEVGVRGYLRVFLCLQGRIRKEGSFSWGLCVFVER